MNAFNERWINLLMLLHYSRIRGKTSLFCKYFIEMAKGELLLKAFVRKLHTAWPKGTDELHLRCRKLEQTFWPLSLIGLYETPTLLKEGKARNSAYPA